MSDLTVSRAALASELRFVVDGFKPNKGWPAALHSVQLAYVDGTVTVSTFDYEVCRTAMLAAVGPQAVTLAVSAKELAGIVGKPGPRVSGAVSFTVCGDVVTVDTGDAVATLATVPVDDRPAEPAAVGIRFGTLADMPAVGAVAHAASTDLTVPVLCAVLLERSGGTVAAVATDRYRLAVAEFVDDVPMPVDRRIVVPVGVVKSAVRHLAGPVRVCSDDRLVTFASGHREITARLLEADFPAWRGLLPADPSGAVLVDGSELAAGVKGVTPMLGKLTPVRLVRGGGNVVQIEARSDDVDGSPAAVRLVGGAAFSGQLPEMTFPGGSRAIVCVNPKYLADAVAAVGKGRVSLSLTTGLKPVLVSGSGPVRVLVMPTRPAGDVVHAHVDAHALAA
jgi:DNA polymerase-3 subunit beta